ncbi:MAG: hypothetical protein ACO1NQ_03050 [Flavobacteriales bacterium]
MRRFLVTLLRFAVVALLAYPVLLVMVSLSYKHGGIGNVQYVPGYHGHLWSRVRDRALDGPVDVLVLGSSLAYRGCDPRVFASHGLRTVNLGSSAQKAAQGEVLLRHHLHRSRPRMVVMIVTTDMFEGAGIESALDVMANDRVDMYTLRMAVLTGNVKAWNTVIYAGFRQILGSDDAFSEPQTAANGDRYVSGGFVQGPPCEFHASRPPVPGQPAAQQLEAFRRIVAFVRGSGVPLILVHPPVTAACRPGSGSAAIAEWERAGTYMDLSALFGEDTVHFCDSRHLDQAGVRLFSTELSERVLEELGP